MLPTGRTAFQQNHRLVGQIGQRQPPATKQPMPWRRDETPVQRKQVQIIELPGRLVGSGHAQGDFWVAEQCVLDGLLGERRQADADLGKRLVETADRIDQHVQNQILAGDDVHFGRMAGLVENFAKLLCPP